MSLEATSGDGALKDSFDPWLEIDLFGLADIPAQLDPNEPGPSVQKKPSVSEAPKFSGQEKKLAVPRRTKLSSKLLSSSELTGSAEKLRACSSRKL